MNILLVRAGALGDVLLTLPLVAALRARYPASRIAVAGYPDIWQVAGPLVDEIISIDEPLFAGLLAGRPSGELCAWLARFDLVILCTASSAASRAPRAMGSFSGAVGTAFGDRRPEVRAVSPYPPAGVHAAAWLLQVLAQPPSIESLRDTGQLLQLGAAERAASAGALSRTGLNRPVFLHPGAGARWKCWPAERFAAVADALAGQGHEIVVIEGPADREAVRDMLRHAERGYPIISGGDPCGVVPSLEGAGLPLRQLAALLSHGALFIGNDSGVTHLAALAGIPVIALFGPTDPASWEPLGTVTVLRHCRKRTRRGRPPAARELIRVCDDPACLESVQVGEVIAAALSVVHLL